MGLSAGSPKRQLLRQDLKVRGKLQTSQGRGSSRRDRQREDLKAAACLVLEEQ